MNSLDAANPQYPQPQSQRQKCVRTGVWLPAEDMRLCDAVAKYGTRWVPVAGEVGSRNSDQCAKRWSENLNPELDHSPWTQNEEERLLNLVNIYGNNWKFIATNFLETRAPLALKNRYALLMRRINRQKARKQHQSTNNDGKSRTPSGSTSPLASNIIDFTSLAGDGSEPQSRSSDFVATSSATPNLSLPTDPFGADMLFINDAFIANGQREGDGTIPESAVWDEQLLWQQQQHLWGGGMELESGSSDMNPDMNPDIGKMQLDKMTLVPENNSGGRDQSNGQESQPSTATSDNGFRDPVVVEYSVTCRQGKLKTLVNHLMDAAISETAAVIGEDDNTTVTLQLKV